MKNPNESAYDQWAATYDTGLNSTVASDDVGFPSLWEHLKGKRILEIGVGTGRHTKRLLDLGNEVVGVDLSEGMLAKARERLGGKSLRLLHGDIMLMPLADLTGDGLFDGAVSALVLEHIADLEGFFGRVASCLKDGASFYISEIHSVRSKAGRLAHFTNNETGETVWLDSRAHDESAVEEAARRQGFHVAKSSDILGPESLTQLNPDWKKYVGFPMVKAGELRRESKVASQEGAKR